jgi:methylase of polypeptide subunit release factors
MSSQEHVQGKRVLELGSGSGFLGILIAQMQLRAACPSAIWLTDINESVLDRCRANVALAPSEF